MRNRKKRIRKEAPITEKKRTISKDTDRKSEEYCFIRIFISITLFSETKRRRQSGLFFACTRCTLSVMTIFLYNFFHRETNDKTEGGLVSIPRPRRVSGQLHKRSSMKRGYLFPVIGLPETEDFSLRNILVRTQFRETSFEHQDVSLQVLANILWCGYGTFVDRSRQNCRTVPSLGERYSLGVYVFLFEQLDTCRPGLYRYDTLRHCLEPLLLKVFTLYERQMFAPAEWPVATRIFVCLTISFPLSTEGYGSRGYRYGLFEAGHVAQNMILAAAEAGKTFVPLEGIHEGEIEMTLGLNTDEERILSAWCL